MTRQQCFTAWRTSAAARPTPADDEGPVFAEEEDTPKKACFKRILEAQALDADLRRESGNTALLPARYGMTMDPEHGRTLLPTTPIPIPQPIAPLPAPQQTPVGQTGSMAANAQATA